MTFTILEIYMFVVAITFLGVFDALLDEMSWNAMAKRAALDIAWPLWLCVVVINILTWGTLARFMQMYF